MLEATIEEVHILRMVAGHPYISEYWEVIKIRKWVVYFIYIYVCV
jgi:hypothetical protein